MTSHSDQFAAAAWPSLYAQHGTSGTYNPLGVAGDTVELLWQPQDVVEAYSPDGSEVVRRGGTVRVLPSSVSSPSDRDTFTISGTTYAVKRWARLSPIATAEVQELETRTIGGPSRVVRP